MSSLLRKTLAAKCATPGLFNGLRECSAEALSGIMQWRHINVGQCVPDFRQTPLPVPGDARAAAAKDAEAPKRHQAALTSYLPPTYLRPPRLARAALPLPSLHREYNGSRSGNSDPSADTHGLGPIAGAACGEAWGGRVIRGKGKER
ncbi:hypothetical protein NDU88_002144 [Pleurodeles waltl]|uniref:Uncharacterized protein n=1 Tax=Pleurodeles waltl TaxID=8319 RepID=A0AAV7VDR7_PLEWA|nr:hypothetical protein NDU88_002144 [Pleurodeles waltl]